MSRKSSNSGLKTLLVVCFCIFLISQCVSTFSRPDTSEVVYVEKSYASDGLDLQAVLELAKKSQNAEALEKSLNQSGGVNNLDLDEDGYADYIFVTEYGDGNNRGFSLTVKINDGTEEQEIATLEFVKEGNEVQSQVRGNEQIYGRNHYYHSRISLTDIILFNYLFSPHRAWSSPYYYGGSYPRYRTVNYTTYRTRTSSYKQGAASRASTSSQVKSSSVSPNRNKSATSVKAKLKTPTTSQKSFQTRTTSKVKSGGFGRSSGTTRSTSSSSGSTSGTGKTTTSSVRKSSYSSSSFGGK